jgi:hypothetical protein
MKAIRLLIAAAVMVMVGVTCVTAHEPGAPLPLDGKPVYVFDNGKWKEARLSGYRWDSRTGFLYTVAYADNDRTKEGVAREKIMSLDEARRRGIARKVYDVSDAGWADQVLNAHNTWRKRHRVPALKWSPKLAAYAQQWAEGLVRTGGFRHRPDSPYGENLATASGQHLTPDRAVAMWGNEVRHYDHRTNSCVPGEMCGHFTQLVWKGTKEVGCAMSRNDEREVWVCNYDPPGNIAGHRPF